MTGAVFDLLDNRVRQLAVGRFSNPTSIQELAIPKVLEGKNILIIAETGSGKTESAMLGIFNKLVEKEHKPIAVLYLTPMKSLNRDLLDRLVWWCNKLDLDISVRHGDTTQYERKLQVEHPADLLISTPEQLNAMLVGKRFREHLKNIKYIVIDELHELVNSKRGSQLTLTIERLKQLCGKPQIIALSATIGSPELAAKFIGCEEIVKAVEVRDLEIKVESPFPKKEDKQIAEKIFIGDGVAARLTAIYELMKKYRSVLTFTNTREAAEILSSRLRTLDNVFPHGIHHSSLSKDVRIKAEKDFKEEKLKALIATSSLQLGIDIGSIDLVLQYQSPRTVTQFTQRVGRSGHRIDKKSLGIIIAGDGDDIFESAAIARKAFAGELEQLLYHENPLDVLAHQIVGLLMENYEMDLKKIYEIVKKSFVFSSLSEKEFLSVVKVLELIKIVWMDDGKIGRRRKAFEYYFENMSTIQDVFQLKIIDSVSNSFVGVLDEQFITEHEVGTTFIVKGMPWRILSFENDKVYVEPVEDIESAVPAWEGELIPVPFEVSQEVGMLRRTIERMLRQNLKNEEIVKKIKESYPVSSQGCTKMISLVKNHVKKYTLPDNNNILFENFKDYTVMHCCLGTKTNETLARHISAILSAKHGSAIATKSDPYRIIFKSVSIEDVKSVLFEHKPEDIEIFLRMSLARSSLFKWKFVFVAKRFGVISKKARYDKINLEKVIDVYKDSPIFSETLKEIFLEKLDLEKVKEFLRKVQNKEIKISEAGGLTPLGEIGFKYELSDVAKPERPEAEIFKIFKKRLLKTKMKLICFNCGKWSATKEVDALGDEPRCSICGSRLIATVKPNQLDAQELIRKRMKGLELNDEEHKKLERIKRTADLVINYGKVGVIVLAGRGVGAETAFRILAKNYKVNDRLFKDILSAEKAFIKNKRFWS